MHPDSFSRHLRRLYDKNGFPREFHLHTLRHYFVSTMLHNGVDKQTVAELAGHGENLLPSAAAIKAPGGGALHADYV